MMKTSLRKRVGLLVAVVLAMVLSAVTLVGCGGENSENPPQKTEIAEYYNGVVTLPPQAGSAQLPAVCHFNNDGTYWMTLTGAFAGQTVSGDMADAGTWKVVEETMDYYTEVNAEGNGWKEESKKTAPAYIEIASYNNKPVTYGFKDGKAVAVTKMPVDNGKIYSLASFMGIMYMPVEMSKDAAFNGGALAVAGVTSAAILEEAAPVTLVKLYWETIDNTLVLTHDKKFVDKTGEAEAKGTYTVKDNVYTLTFDGGATKTLKKTATGGTYGDLALTSEEPAEIEVAEYYNGIVTLPPQAGSAQLPAVCHFNDDGTYYITLTGAFAGQTVSGDMADAGTWKLVGRAMDYYTELNAEGNGWKEESKKTAPAYIEITSYNNKPVTYGFKDGKAVAVTKLPVDNGKIYSLASFMGIMYMPVEMSEDAAFNGGALAAAGVTSAAILEEAAPVTIVKLYGATIDNTLILTHNKKFADKTGATEVKGTYTIKDNVYTLTLEGGETKTLTLTETGGTYGDATLTFDEPIEED